MKYDPDIHNRRSIRLKGYDYSQAGAYFVTICEHDRECLFGEITNAQMVLNTCGEVTQRCWGDLPNHYSHVRLDRFVIMPNHVHGIIVLKEESASVGAGLKPAPTKPSVRRRHGLPEIVRAFKTFSSKRINEMRNTSGTPVWQRNYFDRIIRDEDELNRIRQYIINNPAKWSEDRENPNNWN